MPNSHPAFRAGEHVKFASLEVLEGVQAQYGLDGPEGRKLIHDLLASDFTKHAELYVRIKSVSIYHFGTVLYEFDDVDHYWLESCIVDRGLVEPSGHDTDRPACLFFEITTESDLDESGEVRIKGIQDKVVYCSLRKNCAGREAERITEVSKLRTKANFEQRYGFDGCYVSPSSS